MSTICLSMIVKNEASVISRCLNSLKHLIDFWVICDTGSTDDTKNIIAQEMKSIPGLIVDEPWVDFSHNRNVALDLAKKHADYVLFIDADEQIVSKSNFVLPELILDSYQLEVVFGSTRYRRTSIVKSSLNWKYYGVLHEYVHSSEASTFDLLNGLSVLVSPDGHRSKDPNKYQKDAEILEKALLKEPDNCRYVFYLAQSYRDCGNVTNAIKYYKQRVSMGGWYEEIWYSLYEIGMLYQKIGEWNNALHYYLEAYQLCLHRAEPLYQICRYYRSRDQFSLGYLFGKSGVNLPFPEKDLLFIDRDVYDWKFNDEFSLCCYYLGKKEEAIHYVQKISNLPEYEKDRIKTNIDFFEGKR